MTKKILDIDFDFFFDSAAPLFEMNSKKLWMLPSDILSPFQDKTVPLMEHHEVLMHLDADTICGATYFHIDAHHDMHLGSPLENFLFGSRAGIINEGNYIAQALRDGLISHLFSVCPDWQEPLERKAALTPLLGAYAERVTFLRYCDVSHLFSYAFFDHVYCALSPTFSPPEHYKHFFSSIKTPDGFSEKAHNCYRRNVLSMHQGGSFKFYYNLPAFLPRNCPAMYHGAETNSTSVLRPESDGTLFLSPNPAFAACHALKSTNDEGWFFGIDYLTRSEPFVYLVVPENEQHKLDKPIHLYRISNQSMELILPATDIHGCEFSSTSPVYPDACTNYPSAREALFRLGVHLIVADSVHTPDAALLRMAGNKRDAIEKFFEIPLPKLAQFQHMYPLLYIYLVSITGFTPNQFRPSYRYIWQNLLERIILPTIFPWSHIPYNGDHEMDHCADVAMSTMYFALRHNADPLHYMLAGIFYDTRYDSQRDDKYAKIVEQVITDLLGCFGRRRRNKSDEIALCQTIYSHSYMPVPSSLLNRTLQDADRLNFAWKKGYNAAYFSTEIGNEAARLGPVYHQNSIDDYLAPNLHELKIEITDSCNLSCSFCHQGFGKKKLRNKLSERDFRKAVEDAKTAGINYLRITGGEPCMHPLLPYFLEIAKEAGMHVTLNTNGTAYSTTGFLNISEHVDCFKISLPYPNEGLAYSQSRKADLFNTKVEIIATLYALKKNVEVLTIMTPSNIEHFGEFIEILEPLSGIRWVPLRAESCELDPRPVTAHEMREVANRILYVRNRGGERWTDLQLHLAVPFCVLENHEIAPLVFSGRRTCGPIQSLTLTSQNQIVSCYSERQPLSNIGDLNVMAWTSPFRSIQSLPDCCRSCIYGYPCMGGCITKLAMEQTPYGLIDYLANPASLSTCNSDL